MFDSLAAAVAHNVVLAGPGYSWDVRGTSRPAGDAQKGLRVLLWDAQGGNCAACGEPLAITELEVAHIVSNHGSPSKGRGYVAGNVYGAHPTCNADDWEHFGAIVPPESLALAHLVPLHYWSRRDMLAAAESFAGMVSGAAAQDRVRRLARRIALRDGHGLAG